MKTPQPGSAYPKYVLGVLFAIAVVNYLDRFILSILQVPVKAELGLSDTELGLLTGLGFALIYTLAAVPLGRLADRWNRRYLLAAALFVWSATTALCAFAHSFLALLLFRIGVAVGEAGSGPLSQSLISDYFPRHKRATMISIWGAANPLGKMIALVGGGVMASLLGWRVTFLVVGLLGIALVPVVLFTVREPVRGGMDASGAPPQKPPPLRQAVAMLWKIKSLRLIIIAGAFQTFAMFAILAWLAPFYSRVHDFSLAQLGLILGFVAGGGGMAGTYVGGWLSDRLGRTDARWYGFVPALTCLLFVPSALFQFFVPDAKAAIAASFVSQFFLMAFIGPAMGTCQSLVPANVRALTAALLLLLGNIVGQCFGPLIVGMISDYLAFAHGMTKTSLSYAMGVASLASLGGAAFYFLAGRSLPVDMAAAEALERGDPALAPA